MFGEFIQKWKNGRAQKAAEQNAQFELFLAETRPLVPEASKYTETALFRYAWKRAAALEFLYRSIADREKEALYREFRWLAYHKYDRVAPKDDHGKIKLHPGSTAEFKRLIEEEKLRLLGEPTSRLRRRPLSCIYIGRDEEGRVYVGQTLEAPEKRWTQHRVEGTGPFKKGAKYVDWKVIHGEVEPAEMNELESYYIGFFNAFEKGHNDNRGNDWRAYERGCKDRASGKAHP